MRVSVWASVLAVGLLGITAAPAAAGAEFGDACVGNSTESPQVLAVYEVSHPENPLPTAAPISGVLTRWGMNIIPEPGLIFPLDLKVVRVTPGAPGTAITVGEARGTATGGANSFAARIPIQAGDRIAITSPYLGPIICTTPSEGVVGLTLSSVVGAPPVFAGEGAKKFRVPLTAVVEPDADADGYGDETQDACPQSALYHEACPVITLDTLDLAGGKAATVLVATSLTAAVKVSGVVKLGKGGKATLSAKAKTVAAGKYGRFQLSFPGKLRQALAELPADKKLTLKVRANAANVTGPESRDASTLKLKGQAK